MSQKSRQKRRVRLLQELTGLGYCQALDRLRDWERKGLDADAEMTKLALVPTDDERNADRR